MPHRVHCVSMAAAAVLLLWTAPGQAQDESIAVAGGGIHVEGWAGRIDAQEVRAGLRLGDAKLEMRDGNLHVRTGPAVTYWREGETATGNYTVSATFTEHEYMALNNHPHPYGIVIAANGMGTDDENYLYCAAYGDGRFIVRGFGPEPFQMNGRRGEEHTAVSRAAGQGESVTQQIAVTVRDGTVSCAINGTVVASYEVGDVVQDGRLATTDGLYGVRFGHNTEATVSGLTLTRHD
ncbi:MAG TPA: hypothetical protein VK929_04330 [Longimicrobiales bacterium]|nr:hypothetical protein [Longimicrobiales bacterium]